MSTAEDRTEPRPPFAGTLQRGELLACRTSMDGRIRTGRTYRVRPTDRDTCLFAGRPVRLVDIRPAAYCLRLTFDVPGTTDGIETADVRSRCVYTDSWQPAAIALTPVPDEDANVAHPGFNRVPRTRGAGIR